MTRHADPIDALAQEGARLDALLGRLPGEGWNAQSACSGWSVRDVVLHLAQTEEAVAAAVEGSPFVTPVTGAVGTVDELMDAWVAAERGDGADAHERWRTAHRAAVAALRGADPALPVQWAAVPLKPPTLATTRVAEHWVHAQDIAGPLGLEHPDTDDLWHVARLAHRTLPYAYAREGRADPPSLYLRLAPPGGGEPWTFGDTQAECRIRGEAGAFCRVAARRLSPAAANLVAEGERATEVLELVRTYA